MKIEIQHDEDGPFFLMDVHAPQAVKVRPEFHKRFKLGLKSDLLAKAVGYKRGAPPKVLDATAGLCRDAFHLACLGCKVLAIEAHPQIHEVVNFYLNKTKEKSPELPLDMIFGDSLSYLENALVNMSFDKNIFQVVYLDPMFPEKIKSAKSGKETELLKVLAPLMSPEKEKELILAARKFAQKRVVVKRPLHAGHLGEIKPSLEIRGKAVRYDVYVGTASAD